MVQWRSSEKNGEGIDDEKRKEETIGGEVIVAASVLITSVVRIKSRSQRCSRSFVNNLLYPFGLIFQMQKDRLKIGRQGRSQPLLSLVACLCWQPETNRLPFCRERLYKDDMNVEFSFPFPFFIFLSLINSSSSHPNRLHPLFAHPTFIHNGQSKLNHSLGLLGPHLHLFHHHHRNGRKSELGIYVK